MRLRNTLFLFVLAAGLLGYFFLVEQPRHRRAQTAERERTSLTFVDPAQVYTVKISRPDVTIEFVRQKDGWEMTSPVRDRADRASVNLLVNTVAQARVERRLEQEDELSPYGLDRPAATITLRAVSGETLVDLQVGNYTIDKSYVYARKPPHGGVLLVPTGIRRYALPAASEFRNKRIIDFELSRVTSFTVRSPAGELSWRRTAGREWTTTVENAEIKGNETEVEAILRRLRGLRVEKFVSTEEAARLVPFDQPRGSIEIFTVDPDSALTLFVGKPHIGGFCVRLAGEDRVVVADTSVAVMFGKTVYDLRERRLLDFDRADVTKITLASPDLQVTMIRPGREWGFPNPSLGKIRQDLVGPLLTRLQRLEFARVLEEDPGEELLYYLSKPDITVTIFDETGREVDELVCSKSARDPAVYYATSRSAGLVAEIGGDVLAGLVDMFSNLRQP